MKFQNKQQHKKGTTRFHREKQMIFKALGIRIASDFSNSSNVSQNIIEDAFQVWKEDYFFLELK